MLERNFRSQNTERQVKMTFSLTVDIGHYALRKEREREQAESRKKHPVGTVAQKLFITKSTT